MAAAFATGLNSTSRAAPMVFTSGLEIDALSRGLLGDQGTALRFCLTTRLGRSQNAADERHVLLRLGDAPAPCFEGSAARPARGGAIR